MAFSLLRLLGIESGGSGSHADETDTVRRISRQLEALEPQRARYVASFAYVLSRVANADQDISDEETEVMTQIVTELSEMSPEQAALVVEIAKNQNRLFGGTENYLVTREFGRLSTREQREQLLHCLFAVAAADDSISSSEEAQIWQVASQLGFDRREFIAIRSAYNEKREVVRLMRRNQH